MVHVERLPYAPLEDWGDIPLGGGSPVPRMSLWREFRSTKRDGRPRSVTFGPSPAQDAEAAPFSESASAVQSSGTPSEQESAKRKRARGRSKRAADAKSRRRAGGAKVALTRHILQKKSKNNRTCLADAVAGLFPIGGFKKSIYNSMMEAMPSSGDTKIKTINSAIKKFGYSLNNANGLYMRKGGPAFLIFQEHQCKLILQMKLLNSQNERMSHFVAWDGELLRDQQQSLIIETADRTNKHSINIALKKLFPGFKEHQITSVYDLVNN